MRLRPARASGRSSRARETAAIISRSLPGLTPRIAPELAECTPLAVVPRLGVDTDAWLGMAIANRSLTVIQVRADGTCKLHIFGDAAHLPAELQTCPGGSLAPWLPAARK